MLTSPFPQSQSATPGTVDLLLPGLEYTIPDGRLEFTMQGHRLDYVVTGNPLEFTIVE